MTKHGRSLLIAIIILLAGGGIYLVNRSKLATSPDVVDKVSEMSTTTTSNPNEIEGKLRSYLNAHLEQLSSEPEVLGGKFYITNLKIVDSGSGTVSYEDGHNAYTADFNYTENSDGDMSVTNFKVRN